MERSSSSPHGSAAAVFAADDEGDVRERLLPPASAQREAHRSASDADDDDDDGFTHEELLHSIGSFSAVVWPVAVTMVLARCDLKAGGLSCAVVDTHYRGWCAASCRSTSWIQRRQRRSQSKFALRGTWDV